MRVLTSVEPEQLRALHRDDEFFWLDLNRPSDADIDFLGEMFGWHPLAIEDTRRFNQRPKLDRYDEYVLMVFYGAHEQEGNIALIEVQLLISGSYVISIHRDDCDELDELRRRFERRPAGSEQFVVYRVIDALTDTFFPILARIDDRIDVLEDTIVRRPTNQQLRELSTLKRALVTMRRVITPQRDLMAQATDQIADLPGLEAEQHDYFRDVYDHLIRISDLVDSYRDLLTGTMDVYLSTVSKQLTVIATLFLPLTVATSFFGMNFAWMVRHIESLEAFLILGVGGLFGSVAILLLWLRRAGYL